MTAGGSSRLAARKTHLRQADPAQDCHRRRRVVLKPAHNRGHVRIVEFRAAQPLPPPIVVLVISTLALEALGGEQLLGGVEARALILRSQAVGVGALDRGSFLSGEVGDALAGRPRLRLASLAPTGAAEQTRRNHCLCALAPIGWES
jgi:hypothetical protein